METKPDKALNLEAAPNSTLNLTTGETYEIQNRMPENVAIPPAIIANPTPEYLIQMGMIQGVDLQELMGLRRELKAEKAKSAYYEAMAEFKKNAPPIPKDSRVSYKTQKGKTEYDHASLGKVCEIITPPMAEQGLSFQWKQKNSGNKVSVTCIISHIDGHSESTTLESNDDQSGGKNAIQAICSTVTYLERYTLFALTGLAAMDQDDDGRGATAPPDYITEKEAKDLIDLIQNSGLKEKTIFTFLGVDRASEVIRGQKYEVTLERLKSRIAEQNAPKEPSPEDQEAARIAELTEAYNNAIEEDIAKVSNARKSAGLTLTGPAPTDLKTLEKIVKEL